MKLISGVLLLVKGVGKQRIIKSLRFAQIISGESEYSLNLLRKNVNIKSKDFYFHILPNGFNTVEVERVIEKVTAKKFNRELKKFIIKRKKKQKKIQQCQTNKH